MVTISRPDRLLFINYAGHVRLEELAGKLEYVKQAIADLGPGFRSLADFTNFESMEPDCFKEIGQVMELFVKGGIEMSVRVIPEPRRDPGMNILTAFHYKGKKAKAVKVITCRKLEEAAKALSL